MIAQFALRLICGMSLMWALMPRRQVTSGFFRIQMLVVMGLGVLATLAIGMDAQADGQWKTAGFHLPLIVVRLTAGLIAFCGFLGSVFWSLERRKAGERVGYLVLMLAAGLLLLTSSAVRARDEMFDLSTTWMWNGTMKTLSEFVGAAVLGGTVVGMLLGHWYLTSPTMSIEPLKRINVFLGVSGLLRLVLSTLTMHHWATMGLILGEMDTVPRAWVGLRWLAGVVGPLVVSLMVWRILKYRNTQAATGVLFVGVILAFIGDMTAALLLRENGLPL